MDKEFEKWKAASLAVNPNSHPHDPYYEGAEDAWQAAFAAGYKKGQEETEQFMAAKIEELYERAHKIL